MLHERNLYKNKNDILIHTHTHTPTNKTHKMYNTKTQLKIEETKNRMYGKDAQGLVCDCEGK